ncbi:TPA: hypothetical protein V0K69_000789 [Streptococcus pneumoniae]|nr:hypothetical protein [Streptococcus pneumoniae]
MVILELYQNDYSKDLVAFDSIEDGKAFVAQIPGYTLETEDGFEVEYFNPKNIPDYMEIIFNGNKDASIFSKLSVIPDLLKGDVVANDNIEYIKARNIKISSDSELESDVDGDKSDNLPVEIKVLAQRVEVFSKPKED